ncbi:hypothetical protein MOKP101_07890 [Mycobacterium avium subsp. hominissuis]
MGASDIEPSAVTKFDPELTERLMGVIRPVIKGWHRAEVHGLDDFPSGGALVVSNHSGGLFALDVPVFATDFYARFGYDRPVYTLTHDIMFSTPAGDLLKKTGFIPASHENADAALRAGGVVVVFPGGDYDVYRPTTSANKIDFDGRTGYVRAALNAGVPIVPAVSIGGQENQLFLSRGEWLAKALRMDKLLRTKILPISFGFPFGLSAVLPVNLPLPTKIVTQVLPPVDIVAEFGEDPAVDEVDTHVRHVMQQGARHARRPPPTPRDRVTRMPLLQRLSQTAGFVGTMYRAGVLAPMRPDRYVRMGAAVRRQGMTVTTGFAVAAQRCPDRPGLIDELGTLAWRELDRQSDALAAALQQLPGGVPKVVGIMARNHRGFVESLIAATRVGADVLLLNTSFAGPALADVVAREEVDAVIYDEEFSDSIAHALRDRPTAAKIVAWTDEPDVQTITVAGLINGHIGQRPSPSERTSKLILLTSGTTGTPKGAKHSGGGPETLKAILDRTPWRAEETTVIVAPMFHAWGFGQLVFAAMMACTIVTRRKFDPEATLALVDQHRATGLCVVPVMFDRIVDLPSDILSRYSGRSLRFATASGSRMRPDVVIKFMDQFGDVIYNNYNATEAGMIATATPADLRAAPDTAGRPAEGTEIRILDAEFGDLPTGEVGTIYVRNSTQFDGYTSGATKDFHDGYMSSGDVGYLDEAGRLFVVGRDDEMIVSGGENVYPMKSRRRSPPIPRWPRPPCSG